MNEKDEPGQDAWCEQPEGWEYDYWQQARVLSRGVGDDLIRKVAQELHYNESLHLHNGYLHTRGRERETDVCSYCLLRAGRMLGLFEQERLRMARVRGYVEGMAETSEEFPYGQALARSGKGLLKILDEKL